MAGHKPGRPFRFDPDWVAVVVDWVTTKLPRDFGFLRSRWCCEAARPAAVRAGIGLEVSRETVRRWLHRGDLVYRRPRPTVGPEGRASGRPSWTRLRELLAELPADETAVFQDEVDINTNPKIGSMWMRHGPAGRGPDAGDQREAVRLRLDPLADRAGLRHRGRRSGTRSCSWPTWTTCGVGCGAIARST